MKRFMSQSYQANIVLQTMHEDTDNTDIRHPLLNTENWEDILHI